MAAGRGSSRALDEDPFGAFRFAVRIGNANEDERVCGFSEASGLTMETDVETIREGGVNTHEIQLPGPSKFPARLVLKRGLAEVELWSWYQEVVKGKVERKTVTVVLQNYAGQKKWQWVFSKACPVKWTGPDFRAGAAAVAFEAIELIHRGLDAGGTSSGRT
jgi:phage tail-like protein